MTLSDKIICYLPLPIDDRLSIKIVLQKKVIKKCSAPKCHVKHKLPNTNNLQFDHHVKTVLDLISCNQIWQDFTFFYF